MAGSAGPISGRELNRNDGALDLRQRDPPTTITRSHSGQPSGCPCLLLTTESLILAQNERWRRGLGMQVERESSLRGVSTVANG